MILINHNEEQFLTQCTKYNSIRNNLFGPINVNDSSNEFIQIIIPTHCFYRFFGDFDWSNGKIKSFLHFDKNQCVGIFDNCLDFTVLDCLDNNELYRKLYNFYQIKYKVCSKAYLKALTLYMMLHLQNNGKGGGGGL